MKKIFTFALAILATMSLWASETFTFEGKTCSQGFSYSLEGPSGGSLLENNALYFMTAASTSATQVSSVTYLNPQKIGIVFKPKANVYLSANIGQNNVNRKCTVYVDLIKDTVYNAFIECAGSETKMPNKIYDLYKEDETVLKWWFDNTNKKVIKQSSGKYAAGTDGASMQCLSGEAAPSTSYKLGTREDGSVIASFEAANTFADFPIDLGSGDYTFVAGKTYRIYILPSGSTGAALNSFTFTASCEAPENALVLKASKTVDVVANDEITFSTEGGNGADVTIAGKNGETITANKWTAVKGEHIFTATQDVKDGKCGNTVELKIVVIGTDPVTAAKITGSDKAKVGNEATLTCEAEDATSFQWYKDGEKIEGANAETYKFTPDAAGEIIFACEAWNKNNDEAHPAVKSADFKVTVSEGDCGLLIKANLTGDKTASVDPNSTVGGTAETNLGKAGKLDKKCFFGVTLADGAFAEGDMFIMNITTAADVEGSLKLYEDNAGSNLIAEITEDINGSGEKKWKLPAAAAGKKSIYVVRGNVTDWNAYFTSIAVKRLCGNESKDASLKYLIVNGDTVKAESNVYNYMVAYATQDLKVTVKYEMNDGNATSSGKKEFEIDVPAAPGDTVPATFTVTAEDGATAIEYTINIIRPVTDDSDATIKALEINKTEVKEKDGVFAYEVPADQKIKTVIVEFVLNNPDAKADKASGFEMDVPAAGDPAKETTINVIAKNGTKKEYKIAVTKAEGGEDEGLEGVNSEDIRVKKVMLNGQLFILKNGVLYNATGAVVK